MEQKYFIPAPPKEIFVHQDSLEMGILKENPVNYIIEKMESNPGRGIEVTYQDIPYPRKGFPTPEGVAAVNIVKRVFMETIKTMSMPQFFISWLLVLITKAKVKSLTFGVPDGKTIKIPFIEKLILSFNRIAYGVISPHIMKPEFMTPTAAELQGIIYAFFSRLGITNGTARQFGIVFGTMIQYDNAYLVRLQDILSATTKEALMDNPRKEIERLFSLYLKREKMWMVTDKFAMLLKLISIPLLIPKVRESLRKALYHSHFERLQFDEADRYWAYMRTDYNFDGLTYEERMKGREAPLGVQIKL